MNEYLVVRMNTARFPRARLKESRCDAHSNRNVENDAIYIFFYQNVYNLLTINSNYTLKR